MSRFMGTNRWRTAVLSVLAGAGLAAVGIFGAQANASSTVVPALQPRTAVVAPRTAVAASALATNAHCGQTVTASLTLNGDLYCDGTGLIVQANSVNLNLGGHTIYGPNSGYGVDLRGTSDTVQNGVITGFVRGVFVRGITDSVVTIRAVANDDGIVDGGHGDKVTNSIAARNSHDGIDAAAASGTYSGDHELSNGSVGLLLSGSGLAGGSLVTGNIANDNGLAGISDQSNGNTLTKNTADFNGADGIDVNDVTAVDGGGNLAKGNDYNSGLTPQQCVGIVCS